MDLLRGNTTKRPGLRLDSLDDALGRKTHFRAVKSGKLETETTRTEDFRKGISFWI